MSRRTIQRSPPLRRRPAAAIGIALCAALLGCGDPPLPPVRRVVLVTVDTLRADRVGSYGDEAAHTPTLDDVAASGVRFEHAIAPTPITLPSHASIFTALDPPQHGVRANGGFSLGEQLPTLATRMQEAGFATAAFVGAFVLDARFGLARGFDHYDDEIGSERASNAALAVAERRADAVVDAALGWLRDAPPEFFLWVHLYDPHAEYRPPREFADRAGGDLYRGEIAYSDAQIRRLLTAVTRRFGREDLVVAITSDHGEALGEHGEATHSHGIYDATQRVPLLLMGPGIPRGAVVTEPVRLIDLAPTLLARAGAAPLEDVRGRDLTPLLAGEPDEARAAYLETVETQLAMGWSPLLGLRTATHKYIRAPQPELYDLRADPDELENLADVEPARARAMDATLQTALDVAGAEATTPALSDEERERLQALGYLGAGADDDPTAGLGVVGGPNPRDHLHELDTLNRAAGMIGEGRGREALAQLAAVQTRGPYYHRLHGMAALAANRPELARSSGEALAAAGRPNEALWLQGMAALAEGDAATARRAFEAGRANAPDRPRPFIGLGLAAQLEGDLDAAAEAFERAMALGGGGGQAARLRLAELRLGQGRLEEADRLFAGLRASLRRDPAACLRVAAAERAAGRPERARQLLRDALAARPRHVPLLEALARAEQSSGDLAEAADLRRRLLALAPGDAGRGNDLAWALALAGNDLDEALALARRAEADSPEQPAVLDTLATVHLARGEHADALAVARRTLPAAPAALRPHLLYVEAAALAALGREPEARRSLARLRAEATPLAPPFDERAARLEARLGRAG